MQVKHTCCWLVERRHCLIGPVSQHRT